MASTQSVIDIIFNGIDNASNVIDDLSGALGDFDTQVQDIAAPFANFADQLIAVETAALATGIALTGMAINAAGEFDVAFREIATLTNQSVDELETFRGEMLAYAATSTQALDQVTQATYNAISQGVNYADSLQAVAIAEKLAVAGKADLNTTLQGLLGTLNAYGKGMESASEFSDVFFKIVNEGKTTIPELAASMANVTGIAANGGVSIQQLGAAIATLTYAGQGTSEAITALKATIGAILAPGEQAKELARTLGIQFNQSGIQSLGFAGVLAQVAEKTGLSTDKLKTLFGSTDAVNAVLTLAGTASEKFKTSLKAMGEAAGATDAAFAKMKDATDTLGQAFNVALVSFGTPLLDQFSAAEDALASLAVAFIKVAEGGGLKPLQTLVNDALGGIAETIEAIAKNLPEAFKGLDWTGVIDSLQGLNREVGEVFAAFFGEIDISTVEGLQSALQTVMESFKTLTIIVTGIVSEFKPLAAGISEAIRSFNELDKASQLEFGQTLGAMKLIVDVGTGLGLTLIAIGRAGLEMSAVLDIAFGAVKVGINAIQTAFDAASLFVVSFAKNIVEALLKVADALGADEIAAQLREGLDGLNGWSDAIENNLLRNAQELKDGASQAADGLSALSGASNDARDRLDKAEQAIRNTGKAAQESGNQLQDMGEKIPINEWDGMIGALRKLEDETGKIDLGKKLSQPLIDSKKALDDLDKKISSTEWGDGDGLSIEEPMDKNIKTTQVWNEELGKMVTVYNTATNGTIKATGAFAAVADKTKDAKDQLNALTKGGKLTVDQLTEITKTANDFKVKMEEIASNERIKNIEFAVNLKTAQLETDMERVKATFASIDNTITNTGDLLGSLFSDFASANDRYKELAIQEQIDLENQRRQEALDIQKKLAEAEIDRIEAQTRSLNRGDALITINGEGLQIELEAFMWKIMEKIRIRANAEFSDYLLGIGATS